MAHAQLLALIRQAANANGDSDTELLGRYVANGDGSAFAELVRRYSRLVWGQCRNLLLNEADADDAFQATFLALAKSAKSIRTTGRLGPWLHAVAHRVCLNTRRATTRRVRRERGSAVLEGSRPVADSAWDAAAAAVHEEVNHLPESLRVAFVLCCLEGVAPTEAAAQLGIKWGTFSSRLSRAKQLLLDRLTARGIGAAVAVSTACSGSVATAMVVNRAIALGSTGTPVPASVLALTSGVVTMNLIRGKILAVVVMALAVVAGSWLIGPREFVPHAQAAPVPKKDVAPTVTDKKLEELWAMLLSRDEAVSSRALLELSARPKAEVVALLASKLKPLKLTEERAKKLIAELDDEKDEVAKAAYEELSYFDPRLTLDVGAMMATANSNRQKQRLTALLLLYPVADRDRYAWCVIKHQLFPRGLGVNAGGVPQHAMDMRNDPNKPQAFLTALDREGHQGNILVMFSHLLVDLKPREWARASRAIMILEHIGTPEAVKVLQAMATGHEDAAPTIAAIEALVRLKKK